jgi:hypothetical protein
MTLHEARETVIKLAAEEYAENLRFWLIAAEKSGIEQGAERLNRIERAARSLVNCPDFWKNAGTLPGEYDNLVDALAGKP